ncbi:MAG: MMPL family transporter [Polyangiaceae bacterium]
MKLEDLGSALGRAVVKHRFLTIVLSLLSCLALSWGATRAQFSTDYRIFFSSRDPELQAFERLEKVFTKTDNIVLVVQAKEGDVFEQEALTAIRELTTDAWKLPYASRVDSLTNFSHVTNDDGELVVEELPPGPLSQQQRTSAKTRALGEPLLVGALLSQDAKTAGVNVTLRLPRQSSKEVTEAAKATRSLVERARQEHPGLEIRASGMALMNDAFMEASIEDMSFIVPLMCVVMMLVMALLLRSALGTFAVTVVVVMASAPALGLAGWLGYPLTPPSASAPTIVMTLAVANGVHLIISMGHALAAGKSKAEAIVDAVRVNFRPVFFTSLTTAIGFLCLNFAESPPYGHLANMTATGITAAFVYSFTLLPAMLLLLPLRVPTASARTGRAFERLAAFMQRRFRLVLAGAAALTLLFGASALTLESNDQFVDYFDDSIAFRPDTEFMMKHLSGVYTLDYQLGSQGESGITDPDYLTHLEAFATFLRSQPEVRHVYSFSDVMKRLNQRLHDDAPGSYRVPTDKEAAGQYLLLYEMSLPQGLDLTDRVDIAKSSTRLTVIVDNLSTKELSTFKERSEQWLRSHAPAAMWTQATSPVVIFSHLSRENTRSMMFGTFVSLLLISACLVFALSSMRLGVLSVVPNIVPIVLGYGAWALAFGEINIVASVAGTICLGIIVDDTIHFLSKYQLARDEHGLDVQQAVRLTYRSVGPALVVTSLILLFGFGVLTQSSFEMNSSLGLFAMFVIGAALVADLALLPALLLWLDREPTPALARDELRLPALPRAPLRSVSAG